jgi:hypothetical protein
MQAYIDECTRLKHHLEEILKEKSFTPGAVMVNGSGGPMPM